MPVATTPFFSHILGQALEPDSTGGVSFWADKFGKITNISELGLDHHEAIPYLARQQGIKDIPKYVIDAAERNEFGDSIGSTNINKAIRWFTDLGNTRGIEEGPLSVPGGGSTKGTINLQYTKGLPSNLINATKQAFKLGKDIYTSEDYNGGSTHQFNSVRDTMSSLAHRLNQPTGYVALELLKLMAKTYATGLTFGLVPGMPLNPSPTEGTSKQDVRNYNKGININQNNAQLGYGKREDGTNKGLGYFGELPTKNGNFATEISINVDGKSMPSLVPTLTHDQISYLLGGGKPTPDIVKKANDYAIMRESQGKSPFAAIGEQVGNY